MRKPLSPNPPLFHPPLLPTAPSPPLCSLHAPANKILSNFIITTITNYSCPSSFFVAPGHISLAVFNIRITIIPSKPFFWHTEESNLSMMGLNKESAL